MHYPVERTTESDVVLTAQTNTALAGIRKIIFDMGRYPLDTAKGMLNELFANPDNGITYHGFDTAVRRARGRIPGVSVRKHKCGCATLNSLDTEGVLALFEHYQRNGKIRSGYTRDHVIGMLARRRDDYLKSLADFGSRV